MESKIKLSEEQAEQLFAEIDNQGFGYWVEHYGYDGEEDPDLQFLCEEANAAMAKLNSYVNTIFDHYQIG